MADTPMPAARQDDNPESAPDNPTASWVDANGNVIWEKWAEHIARRAEARKAERQAAAPAIDWSDWAARILDVANQRYLAAVSEEEFLDAGYWQQRAIELAERATEQGRRQ